jgi:hypothetical protein
VSDDRPIPSPEAEFLLRTRDLIAEGKSVYGPVGSPKQVEKQAEYDAKIAFGRQQGEIPPAEEPWTRDRAAKERLASEFQFGEPAATFQEHTAGFNKKRFDDLAALDDRRLAAMTDEVAADLAERPSQTCAPHSGYKRELDRRATGHEIVEGLFKDAGPIIAANHPDPTERARVTKFIGSNRQLLELYAAHGQLVSAYNTRKKGYGL